MRHAFSKPGPSAAVAPSSRPTPPVDPPASESPAWWIVVTSTWLLAVTGPGAMWLVAVQLVARAATADPSSCTDMCITPQTGLWFEGMAIGLFVVPGLTILSLVVLKLTPAERRLGTVAVLTVAYLLAIALGADWRVDQIPAVDRAVG